MSGTLDAKVVRIDFEISETGRIYATSPDIKGLLIGRSTKTELLEAIPRAISDMYEACGLNVVVSRLQREVESGQETNDEWVAFPAEIAREALLRREPTLC